MLMPVLIPMLSANAVDDDANAANDDANAADNAAADVAVNAADDDANAADDVGANAAGDDAANAAGVNAADDVGANYDANASTNADVGDAGGAGLWLQMCVVFLLVFLKDPMLSGDVDLVLLLNVLPKSTKILELVHPVLAAFDMTDQPVATGHNKHTIIHTHTHTHTHTHSHHMPHALLLDMCVHG